MRPMVQVAVCPSQFPENTRRALLTSLRTRRIRHKFLYDGAKHAQKWIELHESYSPARLDPDCLETYATAFAAVVGRTKAERVHVIGLGCGGGQKETQLLALLKRARRQLSYTPCDGSLALVLVASRAVSTVLSAAECFPVVCDLEEADDLAAIGGQLAPRGAHRLITFFGILPNSEPQVILPRLADLLRTRDWLLLSANLAPGRDYAAGVRQVLPQYDNPASRAWLMTFLLDLGVERSDGVLRFVVEDDPLVPGLKRIVAVYRFKRARRIEVANECFEFRRGDRVRLFFSYRHTPDQICALLGQHGIQVVDRWVTRSEEEGVFLCQRGGRQGASKK